MAKKVAVEVQDVKLNTVQVALRGISPLIVHKFSVKAQGEMLSKQMKVTWPKKIPKVPLDQYDAATYFIDDHGNSIECPALLNLVAEGRVTDFLKAFEAYLAELRAIKNPRFGLPAVAFKASAIRGAKALGLVMADMRGAFHIDRQCVEIVGKRSMRSDMVRISHSTSDVRFRPEFQDWRATFPVTFNENAVTPDQLFNMFHAGGFSCGVGEWRPEKSGDKGMFQVESVK